MDNTQKFVMAAAVVLAIAAGLVAFLAISLTPRVASEWYQHQPTPIPTHTPVPTPTPTPTPVPLTPGAGTFYTAVSTTSTLTAADVSARRYHQADRRLQLPQCQSAQAVAHPREYWHILLTPNTARLRHLYLDGFDQLTAWTGAEQTLTLDGADVDVYRYTTNLSYPCGDNVRPGLGGAYVTIELTGE